MSARSRIAIRRAAGELAAHRRRLLECATEPDLDPADALLLRVDADDHRAGLVRVAEAALAVAGNSRTSHLTELKAPASDSRPPALTSDLRLSPLSRIARREGESNFHQTACLLPVGGEDVTHKEEN